MTLTIAPPAEALLEGGHHGLSKLWRIDRTDNQQLFFTDADHSIEFENQVYDPTDGFTGSNARREGGFKEANEDIRGIISSSRITTSDILAGRYREAKITESLVNRRFPFAGAIVTSLWWITNIRYTGEEYTFEISGLSRWMRAKLGFIFDRTCQYDLGDSNCGVALSGFTTSGTVTTPDSDEPRRKFTSNTGGPGTDDVFNFGKLTWTTGANTGLTQEVKDFTAAGPDLVELFLPMPFDIEAGDTYSVHQGCDRTLGTCRDKFSNLGNHGGFPFMPTTDDVLKTPS